MSVKRYEVNGTSSVFEDANGSLVDYEDYAALEARCAALAAENAGLKVANAEGCKWDGEQWVGISIETPATDAFLAEVRAQGIDQWIASRDGRWNGTTAEAERFAAQLRKGVQS